MDEFTACMEFNIEDLLVLYGIFSRIDIIPDKKLKRFDSQQIALIKDLKQRFLFQLKAYEKLVKNYEVN